MQRELIEMRKDLTEILSSNNTLKQAVREVNKMNMIKASLIVRNPHHQTIPIDRILEGELRKELSVGDYIFIQNYRELVRMAYNNLEIGNSMGRSLLSSAYKVLTEDSRAGFRQSNPVIYSFNHVPPHCSDIDNKIASAVSTINSQALGDDVIAKAMYIHNAIIDIWPFDDYNGELAVFALNYYLMQNGLMPIDMPLERQEYFDLIAACLKGRRLKDEYSFFKDAVFEKMASTIKICRDYIE